VAQLISIVMSNQIVLTSKEFSIEALRKLNTFVVLDNSEQQFLVVLPLAKSNQSMTNDKISIDNKTVSVLHNKYNNKVCVIDEVNVVLVKKEKHDGSICNEIIYDCLSKKIVN
jgi:hypothetical protein